MSTQAISFAKLSHGFLDELTSWIGQRSVLEVFAGNGLMASKLADRAVRVHATSLFSSHDGSFQKSYFQVEELEAKAAATKYAAKYDLLLMSWPTADVKSLEAALAWGEGRPIIFIGEYTDRSRDILGGCACDAFFEIAKLEHEFKSYSKRHDDANEIAGVYTLPEGSRLQYLMHPNPLGLSW